MIPRSLLDTNVVSEPLRPNPAPGVLRRFREHEGRIGILAPVWRDLRFGCERLPPSSRRNEIEACLDLMVLPNLPVLDHDRRAADWRARERARLETAGRRPPFADDRSPRSPASMA